MVELVWLKSGAVLGGGGALGAQAPPKIDDIGAC